MDAIRAVPAFFMKENTRQWLTAIGVTLLLLVAMGLMNSSFASDGVEFTEAVTKFEGWVKGNLGKAAALVALIAGCIMAAIRKDWSWFFCAVLLSMGVGIIVGIINASFTAVI